MRRKRWLRLAVPGGGSRSRAGERSGMRNPTGGGEAAALRPVEGVVRNGAYWEAFDFKKQARVACHPSYRRAPLQKCSKGVFSRIIRVG
jgi:hypothetical protein